MPLRCCLILGLATVADGAQCGPREVGTCYPHNDLKKFNATSEDECCAACQTNSGCAGYTFRSGASSAWNCYVKGKLASGKKDGGCSSAPRGAPAPTPPPPAPTPVPPPTPPVPVSTPHILWIVSDDLGWDDLGFRSGQIRTPAIDGLAREGLVLKNYYVQPSCSPTRATFLSGRYPLHHGVNTFIAPDYSYGLPLNETTVAQLLRKRGYRARAIGKWHLGMHQYAYTPTFRGFESFYGFYGGGEDYYTHLSRNAFDLRRDAEEFCGRGCSHLAVEDTNRYSTHLFTEEAVRIIDAHEASTPLFMYLAYQAVHAPDEAPQSYIDAYSTTIENVQRRTFAGMLSALDEGVGNVTAALAAKGMIEQTFIIFTTDNGGPSETCGRTATSNFPHRGSKCSLWEGGTRATGLVYGAGLEKTGVEFQGLMHAADWLPTLLDLAGSPVQLGETLPLDGVSQWAQISQCSGSARASIYYGVTDLQVGNHGPALRVDDMKLIVGTTGGLPGHWPKPATLEAEVPVGAPKPNRTFPALTNVTYLLFNLSADENEHIDIAKDHPQIVDKLLGQIEVITQDLGCMDCDDGRCPNSVKSQISVSLPDGSVIKAWEPWCDRKDMASGPLLQVL